VLSSWATLALTSGTPMTFSHGPVGDTVLRTTPISVGPWRALHQRGHASGRTPNATEHRSVARPPYPPLTGRRSTSRSSQLRQGPRRRDDVAMQGGGKGDMTCDARTTVRRPALVILGRHRRCIPRVEHRLKRPVDEVRRAPDPPVLH